jgi:hypothetical protein
VYRLRKEIKILETLDKLKCKACESVVASKTDLMVMSADGPIGAYVNAHGCVLSEFPYLSVVVCLSCISAREECFLSEHIILGTGFLCDQLKASWRRPSKLIQF